MILFGWGKRDKEWDLSDGRKVSAVWRYFDLFFMPLSLGTKWFVSDSSGQREVSYDEVKRLFPYDPPKISLFHRFGLVIAIVVLVLVGWFYDSSYDKNERALGAIEAGDAATAISELQEATGQSTSDEEQAVLLLNLAYAYDLEGDTAKALETLKQAITFAKEGSVDHHLITGEIAYKEGDPAKAYEYYMKALNSAPTDPAPPNSLSYLLLDMDEIYLDWYRPAEALQYSIKAYELQPEDSTRSILGINYVALERYSEAIPIFEEMNLDLNPDAHVFLGLSYGALGNDVKMYEHFVRAGELGVDVDSYFAE